MNETGERMPGYITTVQHGKKKAHPLLVLCFYLSGHNKKLSDPGFKIS